MILAAAILAKLGETSITLTAADMAAVPFERIEMKTRGVAEEITLRIIPEGGDPDQGDLMLVIDHGAEAIHSSRAANPFDGRRKPPTAPSVEDMTDEELSAAITGVGEEWDGLAESLKESGGCSGSPMEGLSERLNELETERRRRAYARD